MCERHSVAEAPQTCRDAASGTRSLRELLGETPGVGSVWRSAFRLISR